MIFIDQYGDTITTEKKDGWFHDETTGTASCYKSMDNVYI